jgi:hypothetical protein
LEFLDRELRQEEEIKGIQIGRKEVALSLFADMILYLRDLKNSTKKLFEIINTFRKAPATKSIHRNEQLFYILTTNRLREKLEKQSHLQYHKKIKYQK